MSEKAAAAPEPATTEAVAAPAKAKPVMLIAVLAVAVAAGVGGGFVLAPKFVHSATKADSTTEAAAGGAEDDKHGKHGKDGQGRIVRLDNLIVNPSGSEGTRFLMASVAFEVESEANETALKDHDVQLRDLVVAKLEGQTMQMLTQVAARDSIKGKLSQVVATILGPKARVKVYLPQFVIQ